MKMRNFTLKAAQSGQRLATLLAVFLCLTGPAQAQNRLEMEVTKMDGYGRMILEFPDLLELPDYEISSDNGVLAIEFDEPVDVNVPDVSVELAEFVAISRLDPDARGIRFGLKAELRVNKIEAGEQLFIDFLPGDWVGLPPGLPQDVVTRLAQRAQEAAELAEQRRKAALAREQNATAELQVGLNPTFVRLQFYWSVDTPAEFSFEDEDAEIKFAWPVPVDLFALNASLPPEVERASTEVTADGSFVRLHLADGIEPRFYSLNEREYVIDLDRLEPAIATSTAEELLVLAEAEEAARRLAEESQAEAGETSLDGPLPVPENTQAELTPSVSRVGATVRVTFPFEVETPAAVFRRGDVVWMVFDSTANINAPSGAEVLEEISDEFSVVSTGDTQIVRMQLSPERLASLGSQGLGWVISVGDVVLAPTEPIKLNRRQTREGTFEIAADLERPARVHELRDPMVGDVLEVVTMFPPARGLIRDLNYVDFQALRTVHGLVIQPINETLDISLTRREATISTADGLTVSSFIESRSDDVDQTPMQRRGYVDLQLYAESDTALLNLKIGDLSRKSAVLEGRDREVSRLELAQTYLANGLSSEAVGILEVMIEEHKADDLVVDAQVSLAAALVLGQRPEEALGLLNEPPLVDAVDSLMWRSIARAEIGDFVGARVDALAAETILRSYPVDVQNLFYLSGAQAAIETRDLELANRLIDRVAYAALVRDQASRFQLLQGRIDELGQRFDEALDTYGQVIAEDIRPTKVEAVYRTVALLDRMGRLDATKAAETLSTESMLWRGGVLEAQMLELLAQLQFRSGDYRGAFATVKDASTAHHQNNDLVVLNDLARDVFADLYLNGEADGLEPIDALTLYYDYRQLTPPGARGDEMIRNLARRLIRVDLLEQAAELLTYQVDVRLEGAARAQVAADLAIVHLADRAPELALEVLNRTALANMAPSLERQRRILEARALVDAGRGQLALDVLHNLDGRDAAMMRIDALWREGSYREAAEQIEVMYALRGSVEELPQVARIELVRAGTGFVLANDTIGLSRLRSKFAEIMAQTPEWAMFDFVTGPITRSSEGFRDLATELSSRDSLSNFLNAYRQAYGQDGALTPLANTALAT